MILRRISQAIRRQDWFTVLIEICIVVIGLLIGLQINNWNEARADRVKEAAFIGRLAVDVDRAQEQLAIFVADRENRLDTLKRVENMYFGDAKVKALSELECTQLAALHIITQPPVAVPSITEAFDGGKIDLLSKAAHIQALIIVKQGEDRLRTVIETIRSESPVLSEKHPSAISYARSSEKNPDNFDDEVFATGGYRMSARCHFLETTPEPAFLSDFVRGLQSNQWYVTFMKRHLKSLEELAFVLAGEPISNTPERQ